MYHKGMHGGDIYRNKVQYDFSSNINPLGLSEQVKKRINAIDKAYERYPDMEQQLLRSRIADYCGVEQEAVLCGNGASELFFAILHGLMPQKVVIPVPSFLGYERAAEAIAAEVECIPLKEEDGFVPMRDFCALLPEDTDFLFLTDPNNPSGKRIERDELEQILRYCWEKKIWVVLDECFIEFCPLDEEKSVKELINCFSNLIIVRAFTKFFAMPGIRLGYLICKEQEILGKIARQLPEWNISAVAEIAGIAALDELAYYQSSIAYVKQEREFLQAGLRDIAGRKNIFLKIFDSAANFILLYTELPLYEKLLERGILIRDCSNFRGLSKGYYRIAVRTHQENQYFLEVFENL